MLNNIPISQHVSTKFAEIVQKPLTIRMMSTEFFVPDLNRVENRKIYILQQRKISGLIILRKSLTGN